MFFGAIRKNLPYETTKISHFKMAAAAILDQLISCIFKACSTDTATVSIKLSLTCEFELPVGLYTFFVLVKRSTPKNVFKLTVENR